jgi:hypothetical protein
MDLGGGTGDMPAPQNLQKGLFGAAVVLQWCCGAAVLLQVYPTSTKRNPLILTIIPALGRKDIIVDIIKLHIISCKNQNFCAPSAHIL